MPAPLLPAFLSCFDSAMSLCLDAGNQGTSVSTEEQKHKGAAKDRRGVDGSEDGEFDPDRTPSDQDDVRDPIKTTVRKL